MSIGFLLFIFLIALLMISVSARERWRLDPADPLNVDDLRWSAVGYGSASVSLNCLFGAYSAMLLLVGYACFAGVALGVIGGLVLLNWWISKHGDGASVPRFQSMLYSLRVFDDPALDKAFWILVVFCQLGLAVSELMLLHNVFSLGLGFSGAHASAASLATACVAYYYCLLGGYQAVFRTDAVRYLFIVLMGVVMLLLLPREVPSDVSLKEALSIALTAPEKRARVLLADYPYLRTAAELAGGFALGIMPILAAPDAWKRVLILIRRRHSHTEPRRRQRYLSSLVAPFRLAPIRLLIATALPLCLILPLLLLFSKPGQQSNWSFPIREMFALSPFFSDGFILLGMVAAFMSTFDGALMSATHVLLGQGVSSKWGGGRALAKFRVIFGLSFLATFLSQASLISILPNPYALGAILVVPFAIVSGLLAGTSFGLRRAKAALIYLISPTLLIWVFFSLRYLANPKSDEDPYLAVPLVVLGCCVFFLTGALSRFFSLRDCLGQEVS